MGRPRVVWSMPVGDGLVSSGVCPEGTASCRPHGARPSGTTSCRPDGRRGRPRVVPPRTVWQTLPPQTQKHLRCAAREIAEHDGPVPVRAIQEGRNGVPGGRAFDLVRSVHQPAEPAAGQSCSSPAHAMPFPGGRHEVVPYGLTPCERHEVVPDGLAPCGRHEVVPDGLTPSGRHEVVPDGDECRSMRMRPSRDARRDDPSWSPPH